jgi:hypothetical protein
VTGSRILCFHPNRKTTTVNLLYWPCRFAAIHSAKNNNDKEHQPSSTPKSTSPQVSAPESRNQAPRPNARLTAITPQRSLIKPKGLGHRIESEFRRTFMADRANALRATTNFDELRQLSFVAMSGSYIFKVWS